MASSPSSLSSPRAKPEAATVQDVARLAGVSPATVSRILTGAARVAEDKRRAVEAAIQKLKFRPNLSARGLRSGSTHTIGVLTQELESPYFANAAKGVDQALTGSGYAPIVVPGHWNPEEEIERVALLTARKVDGLIVLGGRMSDAQIAELAQQQPVAVIGRRMSAPGVISFYQDQVEGGRLATEHLIQLGHRRIAHIAGPANQVDAQERKEGFMLAHRQAGLSVDPALIVEGDFMEGGGITAMETLLASGHDFTAVFCANDQSLWGAKLVLHRRGVQVPEALSLVGFDDLSQSKYMTPPVTTVRQHTFAMGQAAAWALLAELGAAPEEPAPVVPAIRLEVRETTTSPPAASKARSARAR
ncbi:LacI family DNA-binding transcriptional regulator [Roseateles chitosanitabidus]|jgi:LacI family transcriptional regulator|uniref:LacI family DNA-binding transcriptional regulator n=1 Tax=Roseateles chitosanitabidus TaxID=65048 RepID=UPI000829A9BD|nr:LacI family DNA-binding transcriptional regulator [Roseateles chitosanitabidus]